MNEEKKRPMKIVRTPVMIDFFHSVLCAYHAYTIDNLILLNLISLSFEVNDLKEKEIRRITTQRWGKI